MKILCSIFFCLFLFSCNNADEKKINTDTSTNETSATPSSSKKEKSAKSGMLTQNGDYTSLFNREARDCSFITASEFAEAIKMPSGSISKAEDDCTYILTDENGNSTRFYFVVLPWSNSMILKEIKTAKENAEAFGKDSKLSQYRISETGDTYLSMHQNRMVRILNEKYDTTIILRYTPNNNPGENDRGLITERKDKARERAYQITNYILKKHQN